MCVCMWIYICVYRHKHIRARVGKPSRINGFVKRMQPEMDVFQCYCVIFPPVPRQGSAINFLLDIIYLFSSYSRPIYGSFIWRALLNYFAFVKGTPEGRGVDAETKENSPEVPSRGKFDRFHCPVEETCELRDFSAPRIWLSWNFNVGLFPSIGLVWAINFNSMYAV